MGVEAVIKGVVQGVGFRPAVYRLAEAMGRSGSVRNDGASVTILLDRDEGFIDALLRSLPPLARVESVSVREAEVPPGTGFSISESSAGAGGVGIPADTAVCPKCLVEMRSDGRRKG